MNRSVEYLLRRLGFYALAAWVAITAPDAGRPGADHVRPFQR